MSDTFTLPSEAVVAWRARVGGELIHMWNESAESLGNQLILLFGLRDNHTSPETPLATSIAPDRDDPSYELKDHAKALWGQPFMSGATDIRDHRSGIRIVIATSQPISRELVDQLAAHVITRMTEGSTPLGVL